MNMMTVGEAARRVGLRASALRYYESVGLIPPPQRVSGQRRYDEGVLKTLALIRTAQQAGLTIAEIHALFHEFPSETPPPERWQTLAQQKIADLDILIARAQNMKEMLAAVLKCECTTLDECAMRMME
jgi:MerR family transcriptional regulator, redox-sensitive transcriptional activator SoxR